MRLVPPSASIFAFCLAAVAACGVRALERGPGEVILVHRVAAPPDSVWSRLERRAAEAGLVVARRSVDERVLEFDWITAPGDGRLYLRCKDAGPVGSASLRTRVEVAPAAGGSTIVIGSRVRATAATGCASNGHFEEWMLDRLAPGSPHTPP